MLARWGTHQIAVADISNRRDMLKLTVADVSKLAHTNSKLALANVDVFGTHIQASSGRC